MVRFRVGSKAKMSFAIKVMVRFRFVSKSRAMVMVIDRAGINSHIMVVTISEIGLGIELELS
jgi:hypothetical protein